MSMTGTIIEDTFFANYRYWGNLLSSPYNKGSIWATQTGIGSADLNAAWSEKPLTLSDLGTIKEVKKIYRQAGLPFWWWVFPGSETRAAIEILEAEGFSLIENIPSLLADLITISDEEPRVDGFSVCRVQDREELNVWEEVSFAGFDFRQDTKEQYHRFVGSFNLSADAPQRFFLAEVHGKPAATSLLFLKGKAAGIYFVTTLADFRRKGIGLKLTQATMRYAGLAGARCATLQSSPDGLHVYEQAGFKQYGQTSVYGLHT
ncbi:MAG: GNAT family N-acetyltransferase [Deltaproteobacteria bacterium]|nr:GNAT family N-acetyltransferase [Deltaproteobacteria bacterium]